VVARNGARSRHGANGGGIKVSHVAPNILPNAGLQRPGALAGLSIERLEGPMSRSLTIRCAWRALAPAAQAQGRSMRAIVKGGLPSR
jgi:hypothetical protein